MAHQLLTWIEGLAFSRNAARLRALVPTHDARAEHLYIEATISSPRRLLTGRR